MSAHRSRLEMVTEYLVIKMLSGRKSVVDALYSYFVDNMSPSMIERVYGITKHQVRGYVQRIVEKAGTFTRAKVFIKYLYPIVARISPIVVHKDGGSAVCMLCGETLPSAAAEDHVRSRHRAVVMKEVGTVLDLLSRSISGASP